MLSTCRMWLAAGVVLMPFVAAAQDQAPAASAATVCGLQVPPPAALPPEDIGPVIYQMTPCFERQDYVSTVASETYLFYIQLQPSAPSQGRWVPYDEEARQTLLEDFQRLWDTNWLEDLSIEVSDYQFANGVVGKLVSYSMEERERIRVVDYEGTDVIDRTKIAEALTAGAVELGFDDFLDLGSVGRVESLLREMMAAEGYNNALVSHVVTPVEGAPKVVNVSFIIEDGPRTRIRQVEFVGNTAFEDGTLRGRLRQNKPPGFFAFITGDGTYKVNAFEEDVASLTQFYRNQGYAAARIGQPELRVLETDEDARNQWVELRIPVTEGPRYRVGRIDFTGNEVLDARLIRPLFQLEEGEWYSEQQLRDGLEQAQEVYGQGGYIDFTGVPDLRFSDGADALVPSGLLIGPGVGVDPTVNIVMRLTEGEQFTVDRITFVGNTTTHDAVIRREFRLLEGGVYNSQFLDYSIRRINQLGYFQLLEVGTDSVTVEKSPEREGALDVTLNLQEQNRNQITFGAGVSQYEGFFGQLAYQTSNFLGRGETLILSLQGGARSENYSLAFSEPFLFDRNITGGLNLYKRSLEYTGFYTQRSSGGGVQFGFPTIDFSRMFINYSYERSEVSDLNVGFTDPELLARNPFLSDSLLLSQGGERIISKVTPQFVYNTVDNPIFPNTGTRYTAFIDLAGLGGNSSFYKPSMEAAFFRRHLSRTTIGLRAQVEYIAPWGDTDTLPIFEQLFLGGEYTVRGYDIRSIGPSDPVTGLVLGGNKSLLFNAEYLVRIADPVRLIFYYDAGQVQGAGESFALKEELLERVFQDPPLLVDPFTLVGLSDPNSNLVEFETIGNTSAFKTSAGIEVRFFMPVLNVPFRLIYARNYQRGNVRENNGAPAPASTFRFAVGTTF